MVQAAADPSNVTLTPRTQEIIDQVVDMELQEQLEMTVRGALMALSALKRIHLPQDHFEERDDKQLGDDKHLELAPYVLTAIASINRLLDYLSMTFPAPLTTDGEPAGDEFDLEFDLVDGPTGDSGKLSSKPAAAHKTAKEQVQDASSAFGGMLRSRVMGLVPRLRHALAQDNSWPLLAELDDYQHGLTKAVQGLLFGVLSVFNDNVRREEILPEYRSGVREAVELRSALTELAFHVSRFNAAIAGASPEQLVPLVVAVADRLARFSARPEYRTLRAEDKKAVIDFRRSLHGIRYRKDGVPVVQLRHAIEGFSKFLDAMQAINHREVLVVHDRQRLLECLERLEGMRVIAVSDPAGAQGQLEAVVQVLAMVFGRNPELDEALRRFGQAPIRAEAQPAEIQRWLGLVQGTLAVVG